MSSARVMRAGVGAVAVGLVGACAAALEPAGPCAALAALAALDLIDMRIVSADTMAAGDAGPAHCRVTGVIDTEINFELLLPDEWNGRFMMGGGGGYVGSVQNAALSYGLGDGALERGYATVGTDTGHTGSGIEAGWALDNPERQENFGHRAVHVTAEAAKSIIRHYYDQTPEHSYFIGCSRGGGQGMMESQRYPDDFDGIVSGAPAYHWTAFTAGFVQTQQAIYPSGDPADPVITPENLALLSTAIDDACDTLDGVDDDVLADPRSCGFTPGDLPRCSDDQPAADCVTSNQLAAINAIYDGPHSNGEPFFFGFPLGGENEEAGWGTWITGSAEADSSKNSILHHAFGTQLYKHFVFSDPKWDYTTYDFSTWKTDTAAVSAMLDAIDPDLGAFKAGGGKIVYWTGWSDPALTALGTIGYYEQVEATDPDVRDYARLFMLPGVLHCAGGRGPDRVDWLEAIRLWVEEDQAPDRLVAVKQDASGGTRLSRPVCPYPQLAVYDGTGSTDAQGNFTCADPAE